MYTIVAILVLSAVLFELVLLTEAWGFIPSFHVSAGVDGVWEPTGKVKEDDEPGDIENITTLFTDAYQKESAVITTRTGVNVVHEFVPPLRFAVVKWGTVFNAFVFTAGLAFLALVRA